MAILNDFEPTPHLRWLERVCDPNVVVSPVDMVLQQMWVKPTGEQEWRDITFFRAAIGGSVEPINK